MHKPLATMPTMPARRSPRAQFLGWLALLPFAWAATTVLRLLRVRDRPDAVLVPPDVPLGLSITGEVVLHRHADGSLRAFAARCTHLGCRLDRIADGVIVCPCHGSRFFSDGRVAAGPAVRPLTALRVRPNGAAGGWSIDVG